MCHSVRKSSSSHKLLPSKGRYHDAADVAWNERMYSAKRIWSMRFLLRQKKKCITHNPNKTGTMMPCMTSLPNKGAQTRKCLQIGINQKKKWTQWMIPDPKQVRYHDGLDDTLFHCISPMSLQDRTIFTRRGFIHRNFYTQRLLHTEAFTHSRFYTQTLLHTEAFTQIHITHSKITIFP